MSQSDLRDPMDVRAGAAIRLRHAEREGSRDQHDAVGDCEARVTLRGTDANAPTHQYRLFGHVCLK